MCFVEVTIHMVMFIVVAEWYVDRQDYDVLCPWIHLSLPDLGFGIEITYS